MRSRALNVARAVLAAAAAATAVTCGGDIGDLPGDPDGAPDDDPDAGEETCELPVAGAGTPRVRVVYLIPMDGVFDGDKAFNLDSAARHVQQWLASQTPSHTSFQLGDPVVEVVQSTHPASYYSTNLPAGCTEALKFTCNVIADAEASLGTVEDDPENIWMLYPDVHPECGLFNYGAGHVGLAAGNDLKGLAGQPRRECDGTPEIDDLDRCRWVGGFAYLMLRALGTPRLAGCLDADGATPCPALNMMEAITPYPASTLGAEQTSYLDATPFIGEIELPAECPIDCLEFTGPP